MNREHLKSFYSEHLRQCMEHIENDNAAGAIFASGCMVGIAQCFILTSPHENDPEFNRMMKQNKQISKTISEM